MIGIIGAMEQEVGALMECMTDAVDKKAGISVIREGTLYGRQVLVARCGIGKVHAAMCAQAMLMTAPVDLLLNIGVAGALTETMISGNFAEMLKNVRGISKETLCDGGCVLPYVAFDGVTVSGRTDGIEAPEDE